MRLRIYRTYSWQCLTPIKHVRFGGDNPLTLVAQDELQYWGQGPDGEIGWYPIEVVEDKKPEHPRDKERREHLEKMTGECADIFKNAKKVDINELRKQTEAETFKRLGGARR